ncbi:MAG: tetratricopeptide repeat protein [Myxococcales bacterium]|nr:MAG: tetratricopeptide repeat protein [Myxococcales bacterium]
MSLLKKLFSADPEGLERKADGLYAAGDYGPAKLAYEKALSASPESARAALADKVQRCTNEIARERIDEAKAYLAQGSIELAEQELQGALEVAIDEAVRDEAQALLDGLEAKEAQEQATSVEVTDEERVALLMGQWHEAQADEYDGYGDALLDALLAMHNEQLDDARTQLEALVAEAPEPRYLWLEVGRARLLTEDLTGGKEALQKFLGSVDDDEGGETKLAANLALARLADEAGDFEEAMGYFEGAVHALPEDYRPYLAMGAFLRDKGHGAEALEVLQTSLELSKTAGTDWRLLEELGLASEQVGKTADARSFLEQVVEFFTNRQVTDFPPTTATTLAKLYEADGRLDRAADMYRALSQGSDKERHALYHYEAGRLLQALGLADEARRMLTRAGALTSEEDVELTEQVAALLQA